MLLLDLFQRFIALRRNHFDCGCLWLAKAVHNQKWAFKIDKQFCYILNDMFSIFLNNKLKKNVEQKISSNKQIVMISYYWYSRT